MLAQPGKPSRPVLPVVSSVQYVDPGYLVFAREGTLLGQRFDLASGRVVGEPFSIADPVRYFVSSAWAAFTASPNGVLAYASSSDRSRLAWIDRSGRELGSVGVARGQQPGEDLARRAEGPLRPARSRESARSTCGRWTSAARPRHG